MAKRKREKEVENIKIKSFVDMISPSVIKFFPDYFICGNTYRSVWALREYPTTTEEQAILKHLGEKDGVTLKIYTKHVTAAEERKIISNAANKNKLKKSNTNDLQETVVAEGNLQDVTNLVTTMHRNREPLIHTAVYIELIAGKVGFSDSNYYSKVFARVKGCSPRKYRERSLIPSPAEAKPPPSHKRAGRTP